MNPQIMTELETAAQILLAPPNLVSNEQRRAAESVFLNFKNTKAPYMMCKHILETCRVDYVLFEVAGLLLSALIKEWTLLQDEDRVSLRGYLLMYVIERPTLAAFVRERILQVIALMVKRDSIADVGASIDQMLNQVENLILNGDSARQTLGCHLLAAQMQEFSMSLKSSDIGLPWEDHCKAKQMFQEKYLKRIFTFCCRALNQLTSSGNELPQQSMALLKGLLSLCENVLTWSFKLVSPYRKMCGVSFEIEKCPLKLPECWDDVIFNPQLAELFFTIYWKIRGNPQLAHHGMTCLVQLASVHSSSGFVENNQVQYTINYLQNFFKLVTSVEIFDREALGISSIFCKVILFFPPTNFHHLPPGLMDTLFEQLMKLTCNFAEGAAAEESMYADDRLYMEGFERIMEAWALIFPSDSTEGSSRLTGKLKETILQQIFDVYLKLHVSPPDGTRGTGHELESEEMDEVAEPDRTRFKGQLQIIGLMGREISHHSLPIISRLLEDRVRKLRDHLERLQGQAVTISDRSTMVLLFEDIHWLLMIACYTLSATSSDEMESVVKPVVQSSFSHQGDLETSIQVFGSPHLDIKAIPNADENMDLVLRVTAAAFRLAHILKKAMEANLMQLLSPEVSSTLLWYLERWSFSYLLKDKETKCELSPILKAAHGSESDGGIWAARFLLDQVHTHLVHFNSEPTVVKDASQLFFSLVDSRDKRNALFKSELLGELIGVMPPLPTNSKRGIYKALSKAGLAVCEGNADEQYWITILKPLQARFKAIIGREDSSRNYQDAGVRDELLDVFECLIGVSHGAHSKTAQTIFSYFLPILSECPVVVGVYHNYQLIVESVFTLLFEVADYIYLYLTRPEVRAFYDICLQCIETYSKWNGGRLSLESDSQDETFQDIVLLLQLLTNLLSKEAWDLLPLENGEESEPIITAADICLSGLNLIMPLMTVELLKYPSLSLEYYQLLSSVANSFPEKILHLPEQLLKALLSSVELGLTSFGHEIVSACCTFIPLVARRICLMHEQGDQPNYILRPFLKLLINLLLSHQINHDEVPNANSAVFSLIRCYPEEYSQLVQDYLAAQSDPIIAERLARAFYNLTANVPPSLTRQSKLHFKRNFEKFITEVNGFLYIK